MEAECAGWELCAILEVDGTMWEAHDTIWKLHVPCDGHMGVVCSTWLAIWELCAPYGSCVHHMGASCIIWELHVPYGSCMHHMGAACTVREPYGRCEQVGHLENQVSAILETCSPYEDHMVPYGRWMVP
jgi:hypothetical protein